MNDTRLKVGYLPLAKGSWVNAELDQRRRQALELLAGLGVDVVDGGGVIRDDAALEQIARDFARAGVDLLLAHFLTFTLGNIVPDLVARLQLPVLLWSQPEPPMTGGRIAANSFCAVNMHAHVLWKLQSPYAWVHAPPDKAADELDRHLRAADCVRRLRMARIGLLGGRVPGFYTSNYDELALRGRFGTQVEVVTLLELIDTARELQPSAADEWTRQLQGDAICRVSPDDLAKAAALLAAFNKLTAKYRLDAWAVRCWPEFGDIYGVGVCHVLGCLTSGGVPAACEGDVHGALAMLMLRRLSGADAFFCDLIAFDSDGGDTGLFWHCGAAPAALCKPGEAVELCRHSIMDGGDVKGVTAEFPLKPGPVTVVRISPERDGRGYRLLVIAGEGLDTGRLLRGNPLTVRFKRPAAEVVDTVLTGGFEHHYVLCHGDLRAQLALLARRLEMRLVEL